MSCRKIIGEDDKGALAALTIENLAKEVIGSMISYICTISSYLL
jgi:hypothetical protein